MMAAGTTATDPSPRLIVNADDYGYFPCVSQGIIQAARAGVLGATGILANAPGLAKQLPWLEECAELDLGVHLNLTVGQPLTRALAGRFQAGRFPGPFRIAGGILGGRIGPTLVRDEWRAQIESLLRQGLVLRFLNSHEHVHMLPPLFRIALDLAREYRIPQVRLTRGEWPRPFSAPTVVRAAVLGAMAWAGARAAGPADRARPRFIGLNRSGRLDLPYLQAWFARLKPGRVYELMCHPGLLDPAQIRDPRLLAYHAWDRELALLTGPDFKALCTGYNIRLTHYRDL